MRWRSRRRRPPRPRRRRRETVPGTRGDGPLHEPTGDLGGVHEHGGLGVIAFMLLSSTKPFSDDQSIKELIRKISACECTISTLGRGSSSRRRRRSSCPACSGSIPGREAHRGGGSQDVLSQMEVLTAAPAVQYLLPGLKKKRYRRTSRSQLKRSIMMDMARNSDDLLELRRVFRDIDKNNDRKCYNNFQ